ncbi:hydroxymethylbilane synthase [Muriicola jejuensis]|uniref:Hydroxymethylbilane synthase n=1 Tax=Muriicola jejuensis TaxID=504488 RepID=A0A6P0UEX0_9FLAO|nr:hydroxymethylbilane synthase [Muriicola jejuensis]NER09803.1 hydroxymethylbilane synthase [Muriicola jejuensis]SMP05610.1 hydroxymethylbilane synthase [Muriicola jejuensis]
MKRVIRIGTRDSELALWQANTVKDQLESEGFSCELFPVKASGDLLLDQPLYELGITGIFTKTLDVALLKKEIDIAVHSMKDVPTSLPKGVVQAAVLKRGNSRDILLHKGLDFLNDEGIVATGSLRRQAQWLHRYPLHEITDLRGNVNTRLHKFRTHPWDAAIFAAAGLERIDLLPEQYSTLDWMIPAPAQGAMMVVSLEENAYCRNALKALHDLETAICTGIEREFLKTLEGGCTAPIGALAEIEGEALHFQGILLSLDGQRVFRLRKVAKAKDTAGLGKRWAEEILKQGGDELMKEIKQQLGK